MIDLSSLKEFSSWGRKYTLQENQAELNKSSSSDTPSTIRPRPHVTRPQVWTAVCNNKTFGVKFAPLGHHHMVMNEARALKILSGSGVTQNFVEAFIDKGQYIVVFEWFKDGEKWKSLKTFLGDKVKIHFQWKTSELKTFRNALFDVIAIIHEHGIVHGDIKDAHIFVNETRDQVKLIDFGLAQFNFDNEIGVWKGGSHGFSPPDYWYASTDLLPLDWNDLQRIDYYAACATLYYAHTLRFYTLANPSLGKLTRRWDEAGLRKYAEAAQEHFGENDRIELIPDKELREILRRGLAINVGQRPTNLSQLYNDSKRSGAKIIVNRRKDWILGFSIALVSFLAYSNGPGSDIKRLLGLALAGITIISTVILASRKNENPPGPLSNLWRYILPLLILFGAFSQLWMPNGIWLTIIWGILSFILITLSLAGVSEKKILSIFLSFFGPIGLPYLALPVLPMWIGISIASRSAIWLSLGALSGALEFLLTVLSKRTTQYSIIFQHLSPLEILFFGILQMLSWVVLSSAAYWARRQWQKPNQNWSLIILGFMFMINIFLVQLLYDIDFSISSLPEWVAILIYLFLGSYVVWPSGDVYGENV